MRTVLSTLLLSALLLGTGTTALSQPSPDTTGLRGGMVFLGGGVANATTTPLNNFLRASPQAYPLFTPAVPAVALGGHVQLGPHWRVGAEGHFYNWGTGTVDDLDVSIWGGYAVATGSYLLNPFPERVPNLRVYPQLGIGGGTFQFTVSGSGASFEEVLQNPERGTNLKRWSTLVSAAAGAEYDLQGLLGLPLRLGARGGYLSAPLATDWLIGSERIERGPDAGLSGPFFHVLLGWSWGE